MSQANLDALMVRHRISPIMQVFPISLGVSPARPPTGMIELSSKFLESGLMLPLSDTLQRLIHQIGRG